MSPEAILTSPTWQATTLIEWAGPDGGDAPSTRDYSAAGRKLLTSRPILEETINQLAQRGFRPFAGPDDLAANLHDNLMVTAPATGRLEMAYRGTDKPVVRDVLESLGRALRNYKMATHPSSDRKDIVRIIRAAAHDARPVANPALWMIARIFAVALAISLLGALAVRSWLARSRRVSDTPPFDTAFQAVENDGNWPAP